MLCKQVRALDILARQAQFAEKRGAIKALIDNAANLNQEL